MFLYQLPAANEVCHGIVHMHMLTRPLKALAYFPKVYIRTHFQTWIICKILAFWQTFTLKNNLQTFYQEGTKIEFNFLLISQLFCFFNFYFGDIHIR